MKTRTILFIITGIILILGGISLLHKNNQIEPLLFQPTESDVPVQELPSQTREPEIVVNNLSVPWGLAFLNNNQAFVTQRTGEIVRFDSDTNNTETIFSTPSQQGGEGGLLGIVLHPNFEQNNMIYLYDTYEENGSRFNKIDRYIYNNDTLVFDQNIIDAIPGAQYHDGGRIAFGPDQKLYATTGDATVPELAQDLSSLAGKILRVNDDGSVPVDNPFENSYVYSYGHRNPQGLAWDENGNLWSTEHGPSGLNAGQDELNQITAGGNYGWPYYSGTERPGPNEDVPAPNLIYPEIGSGSDEVWAPAGLAYHNGALYFGGLRGESLYQYTIKNNELTRSFFKDYGRIRTTVIHEDVLYFTTSNTDGRGRPNEQDDIILKLVL